MDGPSLDVTELASAAWTLRLQRDDRGAIELVARLAIEDGTCVCWVSGFGSDPAASRLEDLRWPAPQDTVIRVEMTGVDDYELALMATRELLEACESAAAHARRSAAADGRD